jgi:hypothetical protein
MDRRRFASHNCDSFAVDRNDKVMAGFESRAETPFGAGG